MEVTKEMRLKIALRDLIRAIQGGDWVDIDNATQYAELVLEDKEVVQEVDEETPAKE